MRTLQEKYNGINEGKFTKEQFGLFQKGEKSIYFDVYHKTLSR